MLLRLMALLSAVVHMVSAQGANSFVLQQAESGDVQSVIVTSKTRAFLSCESGDIVVKVNFTLPFRGLMYAYKSRSSPCRLHGTGGSYYELRIPLKGCGTWQEYPRVFMNNVTIRFHPALELEEDETKTVVCRYPPPLTPPPGSIHVIAPATLTPSAAPTRVSTAKLSEVEILIIICLLLFLSLLTLGIGIAYFCLKRRNIRIVRKVALSASSAPGSQLTKLSGSNLQTPSSLLSSVLGHTVRIPRAVPYSAPSMRTGGGTATLSDHPYEDYPQSTSTSGETSETSSSSMAEDNVDASKHLLYHKGGPRSILCIPKAILRKAGSKTKAIPTLHHYSRNTSTEQSGVKTAEMEDQTVTTVLEPENQMEDTMYWTVGNGTSEAERTDEGKRDRQNAANKRTQQDKMTVPLYAQVEKKKNRLTGARNLAYVIDDEQNKKDNQTPVHWSIRSVSIPGTAKKQEIITEVPEAAKTTEQVTKNTTVTSSVRKEVTETRILSTSGLFRRDDEASGQDGAVKVPTGSPATQNSETDVSLLASDNRLDLRPHQPPKSILIQDVADIYVTTTVETESRELKTTVSRDVTEKHAKNGNLSPFVAKENPELTSPKASVATDNWNVVIRQRKPPPRDWNTTGTDLDSSSENNGEDDSKDLKKKPRFDVTIRAIPPDDLKPKKQDTMMNIPPLEMPEAVNKLKEALILKPPAETAAFKDSNNEDGVNHTPTSDARAKSNHRTVRWFDDTKESSSNPEKGSSISSSDSFRSSESLRERSSSEVLEVAPTLPNRRNSDHPMLERSTSEIVTSPEDHVRWIGGVVPVLESLSPEFLANIPVVVQGGFFNRERAQTPDTKNII